MDHAATDIDPLDRIDRSIEIDAPAERVWDLVTRPGWWINEGAVDPEPDVRVEGTPTVLTHPKYGEFRLETVESRPPSYIAYRWLEPRHGRCRHAGGVPDRAARGRGRDSLGGRERLLAAWGSPARSG